jgi:hypothetical protein
MGDSVLHKIGVTIPLEISIVGPLFPFSIGGSRCPVCNLEDDKYKKEDSAKSKTADKMRQHWYAQGKRKERHQKVNLRANRK